MSRSAAWRRVRVTRLSRFEVPFARESVLVHRDIDGDRRRTVVDESLEDDDDDEEEEMIGAPRRKFD